MSDSDENPRILSQWPRIGGVRITLPKGDDADTHITDPVPLEPIVNKILEDQNGIYRLEILSWPSNEQQEWVLFPQKTTRLSKSEQEDELPEFIEDIGMFGTGTTAEHTTSRSELTSVQKACKKHLPSAFGFDRCAVDLAPVEKTIRPTCRLIVRESSDLSPFARKSPHPIVGIIKDLKEEDIPYLFQTIISKASGSGHDYQLSQRLVAYPPNYGIGLDHDFAAHVEEGPVVNLSDYYDETARRVRSNFDLDSSDYFDVREAEDGRRSVKKRYKHGEMAVESAREILEGKRECYDLYAGFHDTDKKLERLYRNVSYYSSIALNKADLRAFMLLVPDYVKYSPWDVVNYVDPPEMFCQPIKIAEGTDSPHSEFIIDDDAEVTFATQGSDEHRYGVGFTKQYYESRGFEVEVLDDEDTESIPDLRMRKDGITYVLEVEHSGQSRPANILTNAGRAYHYDLNLVFIAESKKEAQKIVKILRHPVSVNTDTGARLYTYSDGLILEDGSKPLLPEGTTPRESKWYLSHDGTLELRANGEVIVSGPADESVRTWEFPDVVSDGAVPSHRTRVHGPFVPSRLLYLSGVEIRYQNGSTLSLLEEDDYPTSWDYSDQEGKRKRYKSAFKEFVKEKMVSHRGGEIDKQEVFTLVIDEFYKPQTSRKAPGLSERGRALWEYVEKKHKDDNDYHVVRDQAWRWPRGIESPDRPFIGGKELELERWD